MKRIILASGGMDSFLTWALMPDRESVLNVFVDIRQKYFDKERAALQAIKRNVPGFHYAEITGIDLSPYELPSGIIPNRNAHLILSAAIFGDAIALGILHGEINSDKSPEFLEAMESVLNISNRGQYWNGGVDTRYRLLTPLVTWTKTQALLRYLELGNDPTLINHTVSCYSAEGGHCGKCPSCFKRWVALVNCELPSFIFNSDPLQWAVEEGIIAKCEDGTYGPRRAAEIMAAFNKRGMT